MYTSRLRATVESFRQELQLDAQDVCIGDTSALHLRAGTALDWPLTPPLNTWCLERTITVGS